MPFWTNNSIEGVAMGLALAHKSIIPFGAHFRFRPDRHRWWRLFWLVTLCSFSVTVIAETADDRARRLADELRCPTCQAQSVKDSDAGLAVNMRNRIRELIAEGRSDQEIRQFFVERYGDWVLRSPPKKGFALFLWLAPGVVMVIAGWLLIRFIIRRSQQRGKQCLQPLSEEERRKVKAALKEVSS
jgi:cytochrome c-type biogenesis protein CcmH